MNRRSRLPRSAVRRDVALDGASICSGMLQPCFAFFCCCRCRRREMLLLFDAPVFIASWLALQSTTMRKPFVNLSIHRPCDFRFSLKCRKHEETLSYPSVPALRSSSNGGSQLKRQSTAIRKQPRPFCNSLFLSISTHIVQLKCPISAQTDSHCPYYLQMLSPFLLSTPPLNVTRFAKTQIQPMLSCGWLTPVLSPQSGRFTS
jgi:hypothetical protein